MIKQIVHVCQICRGKNLKETNTSYKCLDCGKNHGKSIAKIYAGFLKENEEFLKPKNATIKSSIRPDLKTIKTVDKNMKISFTEQLNELGERTLIQERYF